MGFDDLDARMRRFETAHDHCVLPGIFMVARLDGRGFTRLTKEVHQFESPYDVRFRDHMVSTVEHLMNVGFRVVFGYTQSDEISLLLHPDEQLFERKLRKLDSVLAGEASASFSLRLGAVGVFDCRISQLPMERFVTDYFRWRQEDAGRNCRNAHCYWLLRKQGKSVEEATRLLSGRTTSQKNDLLHLSGVSFGRLPAWEKRGTGLFWESFEKTGVNPKTGGVTRVMRRRIKVDHDLPMKMGYETFLGSLIRESIASRKTRPT